MRGPTRRPSSGVPLTSWVALVATWFGVGRLPMWPGTWGSLAALPFAAVLQWAGGPYLLALAAFLLFGIGTVATKRYMRLTGRADPADVVVDEVVGQWIALLFVPFELKEVALAVVLFRSFDIVKPQPIRWVEDNTPGALGVMLDDVVAGFMALAVMLTVHWVAI
ncbi:MAG: phosphatidylglycerophosphatase A [Alphaproteobacteria bacterium]|nr:phosphatidylglycerophosphatase A [Alphaproteobacteria bacterium]